MYAAAVQREGQRSWTPSTIFVVTDHLNQLLVENKLRCKLLEPGDLSPRLLMVRRRAAGLYWRCSAYRCWISVRKHNLLVKPFRQ